MGLDVLNSLKNTVPSCFDAFSSYAQKCIAIYTIIQLPVLEIFNLLPGTTSATCGATSLAPSSMWRAPFWPSNICTAGSALAPETSEFPMKYEAFLLNMSLKPIHWAQFCCDNLEFIWFYLKDGAKCEVWMIFDFWMILFVLDGFMLGNCGWECWIVIYYYNHMFLIANGDVNKHAICSVIFCVIGHSEPTPTCILFFCLCMFYIFIIYIYSI